MQEHTQVKCPKCGCEIDVNDILTHQLEEQIKAKYQADLDKAKASFTLEQEHLQKQKEEFEQLKKRENELFKDRLEKQLKEEKRLIEEKLKEKLNEDVKDQFAEMQKELREKSEQIKELNRSKAEIEKLKREKEEMRELVEAESQKKLNDQILQERERIRKLEEEKNELKIKELLKQLEDQKKLTEEMKRKQEQGSMQMQGEVQELAIEEWLTTQFPLDSIEEIKKGARGGDCIQTINTRTQVNCGTIYYESKRTKDFQAGWIEKFKADMRDKNVDVGVLVTDAMPSDMERLGLKDGIWICTFEEFKSLSLVLRENIIKLSTAVASQENKGDKMSLLYDFLTGSTFRMQVEAIVEGFSQMKADLDSEKRSMQRIWKQREKQIEKVISNTIDMYGSVKGIAGNAVQPVKALELDANFEDELDE